MAPLVVAFAIGGCSSQSAGTSAPTPGIPASQSAVGTATATAPTATGPASTPAGSKKPTVDLTMSGWKSITMKGSAGTCQPATNGGVPVAFGFVATDADYPGLGAGLYINGAGSSVAIKWYAPDNNGFVSGPTDKLGTVASDNRSVTIDGDVRGSGGIEHFMGTISCP
jgi:hypothetical protein